VVISVSAVEQQEEEEHGGAIFGDESGHEVSVFLLWSFNGLPRTPTFWRQQGKSRRRHLLGWGKENHPIEGSIMNEY